MKEINERLRQKENGYIKSVAKLVNELLSNIPDESGVDFSDGLSEQIEQDLENRRDKIKNILNNSKKFLNMFLDEQLREVERVGKDIQNIRELEITSRIEALNND